MKSKCRFSALIMFVVISAVHCTRGGNSPSSNAPTAATTDPKALAEAGRKVYMQYCIACHATDPAQAGSVGPDLKGSSLELLRSRVLTSAYPSGYKPKRTTSVMPAFPYLEKDIPALHEFLK